MKTHKTDYPTSPHLQIYRWRLTMILSILHRLTGLVLYAGSLLLVLYIAALAKGEDDFYLVERALNSLLGQMILYGYGWALLHHMFGGLRHFVWDMGRGFSPLQVQLLSYASLLLPILLVVVLFIATP